jgi:hypothetical protein
MKSRLAGLQRLVSLYGGIEEMHSAELQRTMAAVQEANHAIEIQEGTVHRSDCHGREALKVGDRMDWKVAQVQRELAEWKQERLQQVRVERERSNDEARRQYIASRLRREQVKHVVDGATAQMEIEAGRRTQARLDDRFLARRRWTDAQEQLREVAEMKVF